MLGAAARLLPIAQSEVGLAKWSDMNLERPTLPKSNAPVLVHTNWRTAQR
jgi:hypothetical protein